MQIEVNVGLSAEEKRKQFQAVVQYFIERIMPGGANTWVLTRANFVLHN